MRLQTLLYYLSFTNMAALFAIMAQSAMHLDALHGMRDSPRSLRHKTATIEAIKDSLRSGDFAYNEAIVVSSPFLRKTVPFLPELLLLFGQQWYRLIEINSLLCACWLQPR